MENRLLKVMTIFFTLGLLLFVFYKFMTYERNYIWAKEYKEELKTIVRKSGFRIGKTDEIDVAEIKRSNKKILKIKIQKVLGTFKLMNYGHEFGESTKFTLEKKDGFLNCKGWCLDDHLIGLEIEYSNVDYVTLETFKSNIEKQFYNYKIIWTQL